MWALAENVGNFRNGDVVFVDPESDSQLDDGIWLVQIDGEGDCVPCELDSSVEVSYHGGTCDQARMALPASFEAAAQRVRANADAYTSGADWQSWGNAESLAGAGRADGPMSNEVHTRADKRGKEEVERQAARGCLQRSGPSFEAGAQALADGALPTGGGKKGMKALKPPGDS